MNNRFFLLLASLLFTVAMKAAVSVTNLLTTSLDRPLGLDEQPLASWQLRSDGAQGSVSQTAYRIVAARSEKDLLQGIYLWDSGKTLSSSSLQRPMGMSLLPCQRYYWQVKVWLSNGAVTAFSSPTWFETGLLGQRMSGAQWIGSSQQPLSPYRSNYIIDYDVRIKKGSRQAGFIFGKRTSADYNLITLAIRDGKLNVGVDHIANGVRYADGNETLAHVANLYAKRHVQLRVFASQYCKTYRMDIYVDGQKVVNNHKDPSREPKTLLAKALYGRRAEFEIDPAVDGAPFYLSRLYEVGFLQPKGEHAVFSNLRISSDTRNTMLWQHDEPQEPVADGQLHTVLPGKDIAQPMVRRQFRISKNVSRARLNATAQGVYECYINGKRVSNDFLNPGWSEYGRRMFYNTYDVTALLRGGQNIIGAQLASGWWSDFQGFKTEWQDQYGLRSAFMGMMVIDYADGTRDTIETDASWQVSDKGPVRQASLQNGEDYDARQPSINWWTAPGHGDADSFVPATAFGALSDSVQLQAYVGTTVSAHDTLRAISVRQVAPKTFIYDLGQNIAGIPRIAFSGQRGQQVTLRYAEMLWPDVIPTKPVKPYTVEMYRRNRGQIYTDNYRSALSTDRYICAGGNEAFEPRFTYHGFRYIQIEGIDHALPLQDVCGLVMHGMDSQRTLTLETSDTLVNKLIRNIQWSQMDNFLTVPTDCPQRDERLGYTGDGQIFAPAAMLNYHVGPFFHRWLYSVRDNQTARGNFINFTPNLSTPGMLENTDGTIGWMEAGIIVPWVMYRQYGDEQILRQSYPSMRKYMDFLQHQAQGYLQPAGGLGDWLGTEVTNSQIINTEYYAYDALLMAKIARTLGDSLAQQHYSSLHDSIRAAFCQTFVSPDGKTFTPKGFMNGVYFPKATVQDEIENTQTSYALGLKAEIFERPEVAARLLAENVRANGFHIGTGFIGTPCINSALSDYGYDEEAYSLLLQTGCPSWLFPVTQGATTMWERWNSYTREQGFGPVAMNSFNHYSYGAVEEWMMEYMLGVKADEQQPGYKHILLQPHFDHRLSSVHGIFLSPYGPIEASWESKDGEIVYSVSIPCNTSATLSLPKDYTIVKGKKHGMQFASGNYTFIIKKSNQ